MDRYEIGYRDGMRTAKRESEPPDPEDRAQAVNGMDMYDLGFVRGLAYQRVLPRPNIQYARYNAEHSKALPRLSGKMLEVSDER